MSSLVGNLETDVEIKASASKFHEMFRHRPHHVSNATTDKIQGCELHEGEWGTVGSVIYWNYFHEGKPKVAKEIVEDIDDDKNSITFKVIEGDLLEHYKSIKFTIQATPKTEGDGSIVHWTIEYVKLHDEILDPHTMIEFVSDVSKDLEAHLLEDSEQGIQASSLTGKLETDVEIKAPASKFHEMFRHRPHHVSNATTDKIQGCELHEGEWGTVGSVIYWNYFHEGKPKVAKEIVEDINDEKNSITFRVIEGDLMEHYKSIKFTIQATPKTEGEGSVVHWVIEYEKLHDEILDPHTMIEFVTDLSKDLEAHLLEA